MSKDRVNDREGFLSIFSVNDYIWLATTKNIGFKGFASLHEKLWTFTFKSIINVTSESCGKRQ